MAKSPTAYQSYLLRLWKEDDGTVWRASLDSTETGERLGFENVDALFAFLKTQTMPQTTRRTPMEQSLLTVPLRTALAVDKPRKTMTATPRRKTM